MVRGRYPFGYKGSLTRVSMLVLLGLTYASAFHRRLPSYATLLLVMTIFFGFNSVLFRQYTMWWLPFVPLTLLEIAAPDETLSRSRVCC